MYHPVTNEYSKNRETIINILSTIKKINLPTVWMWPNVDAGTDTVTDLATGDDLVVSSGATANATDITAFVADSDTVNSGTATLTAVSTGGTIDLTSAGGSTGYTIVSGAGTDTLKGDDGNDTFTISAVLSGLLSSITSISKS